MGKWDSIFGDEDKLDFGDMGDLDLDSDSGSDSGEQDYSKESFSNNFLNDDDSSSFEDSDTEDTAESRKGLKKQAIFAIVAGFAILCLAFGAGRLIKASKNRQAASTQGSRQTTVQANTGNTGNTGSTGGQSTTSSNKNNTGWIEIEANNDIEISDEYVELTFTVTKINHMAKVVDSDSNLEVKTVLTGSLSGLAGTYEIEVPYFKGIKLQVGDSFTVQVMLGSYNGKTVVCDIKT